MKTFTSLLIACSLALTGAALAQQPDEQTSPTTKGAEKTEKVAPKTHGENAPKTEGAPVKQHEMKSEHGTPKVEATPKLEKSAGSAASATPKAHEERNVHGANAIASPSATAKSTSTSSATTAKSAKTTATIAASATPAASAKASATAAATATVNASPATTASASAAPSVAASGQLNAPANKELAAKKPDPQKVQEIKTQHASFHAQPRPDKVPTVTFNASFRIEGSDHWQGKQYEVFRSYHPERHDQGWYRSHYTRVELIGGGYYYMNNGYWYPAWGYSPSAEYYAYDGPIYVGHRAEPPDRVIADVQAVLQDMGYYRGEVDGLLGPLTRQALTAYQADRGLVTTAAIDEPTLDSLDMG